MSEWNLSDYVTDDPLGMGESGIPGVIYTHKVREFIRILMVEHDKHDADLILKFDLDNKMLDYMGKNDFRKVIAKHAGPKLISPQNNIHPKMREVVSDLMKTEGVDVCEKCGSTYPDTTMDCDVCDKCGHTEDKHLYRKYLKKYKCLFKDCYCEKFKPKAEDGNG